jgi:toxin secretion/phage lysis holin
MHEITNIFYEAMRNPIIRLVAIVIVFDTIFGVLRAIKEKKFNSNCGINGAIRKVGMITSLIFLVLIDCIISVNLIAFIPQEVRNYLPTQNIGMAEFFGILFIAYEIISILKNMVLCGLPVKKIWEVCRKFLTKYTDELPDSDELENNK